MTYAIIIAAAWAFFFLVFVWSLLHAGSQADRTLDNAHNREILERWEQQQRARDWS